MLPAARDFRPMSELRPLECVQCGKESEPIAVWLPGWGCLYGTLSVCSQEGAQAFAREVGYELNEDSVDGEESDAATRV